MNLSQTREYKDAWAALNALKESGADLVSLRAIARFLLYSNAIALPSPITPWTTSTDPRDIEIARCHAEIWQEFLTGDDDDD